ncbi:MAG: hypothetical protein QXQ14_02765 [Candidatus Aenigmatarchaeota archaeon]
MYRFFLNSFDWANKMFSFIYELMEKGKISEKTFEIYWRSIIG